MSSMGLTESAETGRQDYASRPQQMAVLFVQALSSILSTAGSISIIYIIVRNRKWEKSLFHRLMLGLSVGDCIVSLGTLMGPYLQPPDELLLAASGTTASCSFAAVLQYALVSNVYYNGFIAVYYYRTIRLGEREERLSKAYEKWMHAVSISLSVVTSVVALSLGAYNPEESARLCGFAFYPTDCDRNKDLECTRGQYTKEITLSVLCLITIPAVSGIVLTILVYRHVKRVYNKSRKYRYNAEERESQRKQRLAQQAVMYCWAYINAFVWGVSSFTFESLVHGETRANLGRPGIFAYLLMHAFCFPLQGFINYLVYTRPRYRKSREMHPDRSSIYALSQVYKMSEHRYRSNNRNRASSTMLGHSTVTSQCSSAHPKQSTVTTKAEMNTNPRIQQSTQQSTPDLTPNDVCGDRNTTLISPTPSVQEAETEEKEEVEEQTGEHQSPSGCQTSMEEGVTEGPPSSQDNHALPKPSSYSPPEEESSAQEECEPYDDENFDT